MCPCNSVIFSREKFGDKETYIPALNNYYGWVILNKKPSWNIMINSLFFFNSKGKGRLLRRRVLCKGENVIYTLYR